ncbi:MAG: hypothetical protein H6841_09760 [Planctomycetes bacterium]|nr:hypothetical protein [Planctomycetota bacterium]MCB9935673.1 hypothetical protein [Planctomycetota bacterium]
MKLLTIQQVREFLDGLTYPDEFDQSRHSLPESSLKSTDVRHFEGETGFVLPATFLSLLYEVDLSRFTLGPVHFGAGRKPYLDMLAEMNLRKHQDFPWWGSGDAPKGRIYIGGGDPYSMLLSLQNGAVHAWCDEPEYMDALLVASDAGLLLLGLGTILCQLEVAQRGTDLSGAVAILVGADADSPFWELVAS